MLGITLVILIGRRSNSGRGRSRSSRCCSDYLFDASVVARDGRDRVGNLDQLHAGRGAVLRAARRDPAAPGMAERMYNARSPNGCRGCPAG